MQTASPQDRNYHSRLVCACRAHGCGVPECMGNRRNRKFPDKVTADNSKYTATQHQFDVAQTNPASNNDLFEIHQRFRGNAARDQRASKLKETFTPWLRRLHQTGNLVRSVLFNSTVIYTLDNGISSTHSSHNGASRCGGKRRP